MPFGAIFGAIVLGVLGTWVGGSLLSASPLPPGRIAGGALVVLGPVLAFALLLRRPWARWVGFLVAIGLTGLAGIRVAVRGDVVDHFALLALLATAALLAVPATGDPGRAPAPGVIRRVLGRALGWATALGLVVGLGAAAWALFAVVPRRVEPAGATGPPSVPDRRQAVTGEPVWHDFAAGIARGKSEKKPVLVDFYADWCAPCRTMERGTFRHPRVLERLSAVVPVRVDAEERQPRGGIRGVDVAGRYRVGGYPTVVLLDRDGREVDRQTGYMNAGEFLRWLDRALGKKRAFGLPKGSPTGRESRASGPSPDA